MKKALEGRLIDTDKLECLASDSVFCGNNYAGVNWLGRAKSGQLVAVIESNGQDCYRKSTCWLVSTEAAAEFISGWTLTDDQAQALVEAGILNSV